MSLRQIKHFSSTETEKKNTQHEKKESCSTNLKDEKINSLNICFKTSSITEIERSTLFYICCYIAHKEKRMITNQGDINDV